MRRAFLPVLGVLCLAGGDAFAGPPLLTDDPSAVAPGHLELISAVAGVERGPDALLDVTAIDVAYGVVPTLELDLTLQVTATDHDKDDDGRFEHSAVPLTVGFKWEPIRSEHFSVALAPSLSFEVDDPDGVTITTPLLLELRRGRLRAGSGGSYEPSSHLRDGWVAGIYGGFDVGGRVELLGEIYASAFRDRADPEVGFNLGLDVAVAERVHLLASGGTGLYSGAGSRTEFTAYLGLQLLLGPFGEPAKPQSPTRSARADGLARFSRQAPLLKLTDRQFQR